MQYNKLIIDLNAIKHNYDLIKKRVSNVIVLPIIKSDAYGHGMIEVAKKLQSLGCNCYGVFDTEEAMSLVNSGITGNIITLLQGLAKEL